MKDLLLFEKEMECYTFFKYWNAIAGRPCKAFQTKEEECNDYGGKV